MAVPTAIKCCQFAYFVVLSNGVRRERSFILHLFVRSVHQAFGFGPNAAEISIGRNEQR